MKTGLWMLTGLMLLLWTAGMAVTAELVQWLAAQLPQWVGAMPELQPWPWPAWLSPWVDPALLQSLQGLVLWLVELLRPLVPSLAALGTVLSVAVWVLWGLGLFAALALATLGHVLIGRRQRRRLGPA